MPLCVVEVGMWEVSLFCTPFCCDPKIALKIKSIKMQIVWLFEVSSCGSSLTL